MLNNHENAVSLISLASTLAENVPQNEESFSASLALEMDACYDLYDFIFDALIEEGATIGGNQGMKEGYIECKPYDIFTFLLEMQKI